MSVNFTPKRKTFLIFNGNLTWKTPQNRNFYLFANVNFMFL